MTSPSSQSQNKSLDPSSETAPSVTAKNSLWGGRFSEGPSAIMQEINASIGFDQKMAHQDIKGSLAHAQMLCDCGILSSEDLTLIQSGLSQIKQEIDERRFTFKAEHEDIHMNIETRLREIIGDPAGRLHTARSRNDQVATDFKLWVRDAIDRLDQGLEAFQTVLLSQAEANLETIMPGFTHLQTAQPVTFAHHLMSYVEMIGRDRGRFEDCRYRLNECPLGAAALAGTSYPIDRFQTASLLGFDAPTANSMDSVSDRDFAMEFLSACAILSIHLSRLAEEIIIWCSTPFNFIHLSDAFTTGSSIMPQKRNPDAAELVRGKAGRILASAQSLMVMMKGLPLSYSKDMQEDKEPVFEAEAAITLCLAAMTGMVADLTPNKDAMRLQAQAGYATATDLADWLVQNLNLPFRECHHIVGKIVALAEAKNCDLAELDLETMQAVHPKITQEVYSVLTAEASAQSRQSFGGTSPKIVANAIALAKEKYLR